VRSSRKKYERQQKQYRQNIDNNLNIKQHRRQQQWFDSNNDNNNRTISDIKGNSKSKTTTEIIKNIIEN
jgi:predicted ATPase with chaperone activity